MVDFLVVIEGGGSTRSEQVRLREGFAELFKKLPKNRRKPRIVCAGGRREAFSDFERALKANPSAICLLLVDSEAPVDPSCASPWDHVASRSGDGWKRPARATDEQLHFMVEAMEAWLLADPEALATYYGSEFKRDKLPKRNLEHVPKIDLAKALEAATKNAKTKGKYQKAHGFDLVGRIDPAKVRRACPRFAERFFMELEKR
jgi:hypothetical protein